MIPCITLQTIELFSNPSYPPSQNRAAWDCILLAPPLDHALSSHPAIISRHYPSSTPRRHSPVHTLPSQPVITHHINVNINININISISLDPSSAPTLNVTFALNPTLPYPNSNTNPDPNREAEEERAEQLSLKEKELDAVEVTIM